MKKCLIMTLAFVFLMSFSVFAADPFAGSMFRDESVVLENYEEIANSTDGKITLKGGQGTNNEDLSFDLETTANEVALSSSTGVVDIDLGSLYLQMTEVSAPGSPAANTGYIYVADDTGTTTPYFKDSGGTATSLIASSSLHTDTVSLSNADIKALRGTKKELVATPGADKLVEVLSAVLILDYGSEVLTESTDNLVVQYATSGDDITAAIEMTGFIDQSADTVMAVRPSNPLAANAATDMVNNAVELFNTGDGEFGGNVSADTTMTVKITYRVHTAGL